MKRFDFRLDPYLKVCQRREELEQIRLAELFTELKKLDALKKALELTLMTTQLELSRKTSIPAYEAGWYIQRIEGLRREIEEVCLRLGQTSDQIESQKLELVEARRRLRPVERLKERRLKQFEKEIEKQAQSESDDLFLQRFHRP